MRRLAALAPVALFVFLAWPALRENSAVYDETIYAPAGYTYLTRGDFRLGPENPWLLKTLFALPLLSLHPVVSPDAERAFAVAARELDAEWVFGDRFLYRDNRPEELLFRARLVALGLAAGLVLLVYAWAHELFGAGGALFAATLLALDPSFLAHGSLATIDVGAVVFLMGTLYFARRTLRRVTVRDAVATALLAAAAVAAKFSTVLLVPILGTFCLLRLVHREPWPVAGRLVRGWRGRVAFLVVLVGFWGATAVASLWLVYGPHRPGEPNPGFTVSLARQVRMIRSMRIYSDARERGEMIRDNAVLSRMTDATPPGLAERIIMTCADWHLLPEGYLSGLAYQSMKAQSRASFLLGRFSLTGSRAYFPVAFVVKTPLATILFLTVTLVLLFDPVSRLRRDLDVRYLLVPAAIIAVAAVGARLNIGHRHILPLYPFLYVLAGSLPGELRRLIGPRSLPVIGAGLLLLGAETVAARPYFLSFFNVVAGGSRGGLRLLTDSNLDWGQGLVALRQWMDANRVERVNLAYFGSADPAAYGIRFIPLDGANHVVLDAGTLGYAPQTPEVPGWVAVGATHLQGVYFWPQQRDPYAFLRAKAPAAILAGGAMHVYWVDRWGE